MTPAVIRTAASHLRDVLRLCFQHQKRQRGSCGIRSSQRISASIERRLSIGLATGRVHRFRAAYCNRVRCHLEALQAGDLAILVQSTNFRMDAYRIRVELFKQGLKVIEHPHLGRMAGKEALIYLDALAYDADYYRGVGRGLKAYIDAASGAVVDGGGAQIVFDGPLEDAKLNIGDYSEMKNWGGQFPIGEVFSEAKDLAIRFTVKFASLYLVTPNSL